MSTRLLQQIACDAGLEEALGEAQRVERAILVNVAIRLTAVLVWGCALAGLAYWIKT